MIGKVLFKPHTGVLCGLCLKVIVSWDVHDYKTCGCENEAMVDGGRHYLRYGSAGKAPIELVRISAIRKTRKR